MRAHVLALQPVEQDDLVDAVEEFRPEMRRAPSPSPRSRTASVSSPSGWLTRYSAPRFEVMTISVLRKSTVRPCPSVSRPSSSTCKQHVEHVGMRLLDLVEQHHLIGPPPHRFGERAAFLVADIARRRADQPRHRVLLHVFATCRCGPSRSRRRTGTRASALVSSVLPTPVGPRNMNEPIGRLGSCRPARARRTAVDTAAHRLALADDALGELAPPSSAASRVRPRASCRPARRSSATPPARRDRRSPPPP